MFRSFVSVMLGLMAIFVIRMLASFAALRLYGPSPAVQGRVFAFYLATLMVAAFLGGLFTGYLAGERRLRHGYVLAIVLLILNLLAAMRAPVMGAPAQQILLVIGSPILAIFGAWTAEKLAHSTAV